MKLPRLIRGWLTDIAMRMARLTKGGHYGNLVIAVVSDVLWDEWRFCGEGDGIFMSRHIQTPEWCDVKISETKLLQADGYTYKYYDVAVKKKIHRVHLGVEVAPDQT